MELTREHVEAVISILNYSQIELPRLTKSLLAHDTALRTKLEAVEQERDDLKDRVEDCRTKLDSYDKQLATETARVQELEEQLRQVHDPLGH